jgi:predicted acetyltransferase
MEIRLLNGLELQEAHYIWSQSFERGDRAMHDWKEWEERVPTGRTTYGIYHGSALQAAFVLVDEAIHVGTKAVVPMSAVCGVGVLPASRGRGYASKGVRVLFERMRESGHPVSFLEPFSWEFYGRLGYAWTAPTRRYSAPTRLLPTSPETAYCRAAGAGDRAGIVDCYTRFARGYRGMVARRAEVWDWMADASKKEHTYTYVYSRGAEIEGYFTYHGGKREETRLDEFIALTPRARRGLIGLLRRHDMQIEKFRWDAPIDDPLWHCLLHDEIETTLFTRTMARIVDVEAALRALCPAPERRGAVRVAVTDESAPWNQRTWQLEFDAGRVTGEPTAARPQASLDIQAVAQAYLGSPTVAELRAAGRIEVHDEAAFTCLQELFAGPPAWCNDAF